MSRTKTEFEVEIPCRIKLKGSEVYTERAKTVLIIRPKAETPEAALALVGEFFTEQFNQFLINRGPDKLFTCETTFRTVTTPSMTIPAGSQYLISRKHQSADGITIIDGALLIDITNDEIAKFGEVICDG